MTSARRLPVSSVAPKRRAPGSPHDLDHRFTSSYPIGRRAYPRRSRDHRTRAAQVGAGARAWLARAQSSEGRMTDTENLDLLWGVKAIAAALGRTERQVFHMLEA